jgi:hypothetical protein
MKMGRLIAAAVVLAALAATLYWSNHRAPVEEAAKIAASAPSKIVSFKQEDVGKLEVKKKDGDDVVLTRVGSENWKIISPKSYYADQDAVSSVLRDLSSLDADRVIEEKASNLKQYGLSEPAIEVSTTGKDGKSQKLLIGDNTPAGGDAYALLEGDPRVFTVVSSIKTNFDKGLTELRDKHLLTVDFDKVNSVELAGPKLHVTFGSESGQWVAQNPKNLRADISKFEEVFEKLRAATMDPGIQDADMKKTASSFSSGNLVATVKVADPSGSQELQIRKNKDAYYAKTTAMEGLYKVASDLADAVDKNIEDFLEKRLFDFASNEPEKIEMHDGAKTYFLSRTGGDWWSNGKKMDPASVEDFLRTIHELKATKFASAGFSGPTLTLTVTSGDGKRIEKVQIAKAGSGYIAKREDAPQLYELDENGLAEMRKSADGVKPAEQAPAKK